MLTVISRHAGKGYHFPPTCRLQSAKCWSCMCLVLPLSDLWHHNSKYRKFQSAIHEAILYSLCNKFCIWVVEERKVCSFPAWKEVMRTKVTPGTAPGCQLWKFTLITDAVKALASPFCSFHLSKSKKIGAATRNLISKVQFFLAADEGWMIFFVFRHVVAYQWRSVVTGDQVCFDILYREVQYFLFVYLI